MFTSIRKFLIKSGQPPGTLAYIGDHESFETRCSLIRYNEQKVNEKESVEVEEISSLMDKSSVNWIQVSGLGNPDKIAKLGAAFDLHNLLLEDIMNTGHLPKIEQFGEYLFVIIKYLYFQEQNHEIKQEHVCFILGKNQLISLSEKPISLFDPVRERLEKWLGKARQRKADYLFTLLIDKLIDQYYHVLGRLEQQIEEMETGLIDNPAHPWAEELLDMKKQLIVFKRYTDPIKEEIRRVIREENELINKTTIHYLKDVNDHVNHLMQTSESFRENLSGLMELNAANAANKMNNVMMTLTIIATIFIPLTFIAGIYGMNFQYMPELQWHYGYFAALAFMLIIGVGMYIYMKKRKWF